MRNDYISIFDVIGPVMVGPSSSHTSGAASIAWMARQIFTGTPVRAVFTLYGSFADTYKGHGTDRALVGGMLGYRPDDTRIRDSFEHAREAGLDFSFVTDHETEMKHPNTVDILMESSNGHTLTVRGESIGGGRIRIVRMNGIDVDFTGEYSTLIVGHDDRPGVAAYITGILSDHNVNIAFMKLFREEKGKSTITVIESDEYIPDEAVSDLLANEQVSSVDVIEI
ncbi:MAG: L-serine ammonia-lyase, iron-sulfur-dependent subunit beta [Mogibacterium sp.]|nr:L-serine ammonia-lyase, iron-sulfur-dependent subunit beta [Mogibacterium sp.]